MSQVKPLESVDYETIIWTTKANTLLSKVSVLLALPCLVTQGCKTCFAYFLSLSIYLSG